MIIIIIIIRDQYTFVTNKFLQMLNMNDSKENPLPQKKVRKETNRQMNKLLSPFYLLSFLKDPILILFPFTKPRYSHHINHEEKSQYWNSTHWVPSNHGFKTATKPMIPLTIFPSPPPSLPPSFVHMLLVWSINCLFQRGAYMLWYIHVGKLVPPHNFPLVQ